MMTGMSNESFLELAMEKGNAVSAIKQICKDNENIFAWMVTEENPEYIEFEIRISSQIDKQMREPVCDLIRNLSNKLIGNWIIEFELFSFTLMVRIRR